MKNKQVITLKKHYEYGDDNECQGKENIGNLFGEVDEDYYKPIITKSAFNNNYIEYESKGDNDKNWSPKEYFDIIRPYDKWYMINDHKTKKIENSVDNANQFYFS